MTVNKQRTLLIGGLGFIGNATAAALLSAGREVAIADIGQPRTPDSRIQYHVGDYGDAAFLSEALADVDEIVLLAYASVPQTSFEDPLADLTNNLPPALVLLEAVRQRSVKKVVILSSGGTVYGRVETTPIAETAQTNPISPYGITKLAIEKYAGMYHELYDLPTVVLRPANAYGEAQRPFTGQGFIATAVASVIQGKEIILFGEQGSVRDYVHVDDIATAILAALDQGVAGHVYNVGTGVGTSNRDILAQIEQLAAPHELTVSLTVKPERHFDVPVNVLDSTKLTQATGWTPTVSLTAGLQRTWNTFYENTNSHRPTAGL